MDNGEIHTSVNLIIDILRYIEKHNLRYFVYFGNGDSKSYVSFKNVYERV